MISPKAIMDQITALERNRNVHLNYKGVDCWPVVRNTLMTLVTHGVKEDARKGRVNRMVKAFFSFLSLILFPKPVYAAILTDYKYQTLFGGAYWFRDASVVKHVLEQKGQPSVLITQSPVGKNGHAEGTCTIYFLTALSSLLSIILRRLDRSGKLDAYVDFILASNELASLLHTDGSARERLIRNICFVVVARRLFVMILRRLRVKKCFIVCYYSCLGMALCAACRALSIEAIDMQHGVAGSSMRAYGRWSSFPGNGQLNTLPETFYCWTEMDRRAIDEWASKTNGRHRAFLTGNIWRDFVTNTAVDASASAEEQRLSLLCAQYSKVIVFCAQRSVMPDIVKEALLNAPSDWLFLIRLHPNTETSQLYDVQERYRAITLNVDVVDATKVPIQALMKRCHVHITEWSAAVYDAYFEGVDSIVLTKFGEDYFSGFCEQGIVTRVSGIDGLLGCLAQKLSGRGEGRHFIKEKESLNIYELVSL